MITIVDAGPLYALINRREHHHRWATEQANLLTPPFYTCGAVLSEAHFLLRRVPRGHHHLNTLVRRGLVDLSFAAGDHMDRISNLMDNHADVPMSFADACLVCMVESNPQAQVFTTNSDFQIYRAHRDQDDHHRTLSLLVPR